MGTPVRSVLPGEVIQAEFAGAYGRQVKVRHADGTVTSYGHMSEFTVNVGDVVAAGTQVGSIGMSGNTTGPHVHFEVLLGGSEQVDPEPVAAGPRGQPVTQSIRARSRLSTYWPSIRNSRGRVPSTT